MTTRTGPSRLHRPEQLAAYLAAPRTGRWSPRTWLAAGWAALALRRTRRALAADGVRAHVPRPPRLPDGARRGVEAVLRRTSPTCLERSLVLRTWLAAHGVPCEVVIGVRRDASGDVTAHAWLDVESDDATARTFREIHRWAP
ncbi:lasso peptide biosynthesis B2 protein [Cellulomonas carbonis]|uniref:Microcin J25-processing protein McjB C-terminal domain-containing protein n=1 Tax=Cellulomonas carbonis T26 TaxID=947969 RepID=A0A0A0BLC2_9CELL|nr:lasso peptide biosynthesis B2 protein [Cellulomonas carbonis]KGM08497.1 hypothetical protein N868_08730 [Cellulomonas carbonis T26]GGC05535.1 hypothetical protein GCM10010972_18420 [Cellulomonas carbonis]